MTPTQTREIRANVDSDLVSAIDALAMAACMHTNAYMCKVLDKHVRDELHKVSVISNALRGNPLMTDHARSGL
jgi:hypothetical protein